MKELLYDLFRNDYVFTFFTSFLAITLKSFSTKELNKKSFDLGIELILIALSFCAGNISQLNSKISENQETIIQLTKYKEEKINNIMEVNRIDDLLLTMDKENVKLQSYSDNFFLLGFSYISLLFVTSLMIRAYENNIPDETSLMYQIIIPNIIGMIAIVWAVLFSV
ncbi:MAG: hypothetical protein KatS3mg035_0121 [Bacteroidia bacterium]|nr:MAG: hypothetical protein KatS3mg035_0121 [Bacteroidia bacterium]